jgi:hypothetical protein
MRRTLSQGRTSTETGQRSGGLQGHVEGNTHCSAHDASPLCGDTVDARLQSTPVTTSTNHRQITFFHTCFEDFNP